MYEQHLTTNDKHPVVRVGDTVHRPTGWWTPAVHGLLKYLESIGWEYSPRVLGFDEMGREILSYIDGDSGAVGWTKILSDEGLARYANFLRKYHDVIADYRPPSDSEWAYGHSQLGPGEVICHGDFGPWNIVWNGDEPIGIIDWDMARPAKPEFDVLYALEYAAPFRDDEQTLQWHHFPQIPDRKHRIEVFVEAYGIHPIPNITTKVATMEREVNAGAREIGARGMEPQATWLKDGTIAKFDADAAWIESHPELFD